ncbi:MAG: IS1 family transposase [Bacteroidota bacterium]
MANHLPIEKKSLILSLLTEGQSVRATARIADVSQTTVLKLLVDAGDKARDIHDSMMMNIQSKFIETDEIWAYVAKKQKRVRSEEEEREAGDFYTFICLDADTKLVPVYRVGKRNARVTVSVMKELSLRVTSRFQLSTDAFKPYADAVSRVWGADIDYAQIHKEYAEMNTEKRYSPGHIIRTTKNPIFGSPINDRISTSYVERQNLTVRMQMRRFTRLTNAFSKKVRNLEAAVDLHFYHYNFVRTHQTLRVTPAMEAGITKRLWNWEDLLTWGEIAKAA